MKASFALLAVCNVTLLALTAVMGLSVEGADGFARHFLLGLLAAFYACFVQVVVFMYFVVQEKVVRQSALSGGVAVAFHERMLAFKSRALRLSLAGIGSILITVGLGASIGTLEAGKSCDLAIWNVERPAELVYRMGLNPLHARVWGGA